ncbi:helix-turn-helix domain-containing protein [Bacillus sp. Sa1BUA2]|uniref:Helix-turn-helix domain-containing protein n=1 Tax=Bacillus norwichensis TaxID=2762217 RepID=A0ABR8VND6_9BACI|nr:helix-turn-helix domain-containing protein [Bacillus norwichensis]
MDLREKYLLLRRKKKITAKEIAKYIRCSASLISRYETGDCGMMPDKVKAYREYIDKN